jgi:hypothetical protein
MNAEILEYTLMAIGAAVVLLVALVVTATISIYDYIKGRIRYRQLQKERKINHMVERYLELTLEQPKRFQLASLRKVMDDKKVIKDLEAWQGVDDYNGIFKELLEEIK